MTLQLHDPSDLTPLSDRLGYAQSVVRAESAALLQVADRLDDTLLQAIDLFYACTGRVCITGTGKSADVGQKIAGTLNSTGTRAYCLDATRAVHGDLGMLHPDDVVFALSHSGESEEIVRLLPSLKTLARAVVAMTSRRASTLAIKADVAIILGPLEEVCPLGLAPSTSTTAMIAVGDALAFVLTRMRQFRRDDFARFHPAGSLGRKLLKVESVMRVGSELRLALESETVRSVFAHPRQSGRRTGAVMLTGADGRLTGLFTDSDLARLFERRQDAMLDRPIAEVMTRAPLTLTAGARLMEAVEIMQSRKISELPIVDELERAIGLLDITDVLSLLPRDEAERMTRVA